VESYPWLEITGRRRTRRLYADELSSLRRYRDYLDGHPEWPLNPTARATIRHADYLLAVNQRLADQAWLDASQLDRDREWISQTRTYAMRLKHNGSGQP
jgi:hypothetical protein